MMRCSISLALVSALAGSVVQSLTPSEWRRQSIYQVLTDRFVRTDGSTGAACDAAQGVYCGGTWQGLASKLDYIQGMGFTAVWISPMVKQMDGDTQDGSSYHGYWAQDITKVNSAFGTEDDLLGLSGALHERGMHLMLDVVTNHFAYNGCGDCVDYALFNPFSSSSYFHPFCSINYGNQTSAEVCWEGDDIVSLPDLRTEGDDVRQIWYNWINETVAKYSIDGLRLDSAREVEQSFWPDFEDAAGIYIIGEVLDGDPNFVAPYQNYMSGLLDYPSYFWIKEAFQSASGSMSNLANGINTLKSVAKDTSLYGSFIENHDQERFPALTSDMSALDKNAIAFVMLKDGIPIIYEGQEQHYSGSGVPDNREAIWPSGYATDSELYKWIASLNRIRSHAVSEDVDFLTYQAYPVYSDGQIIAMRKGFDGYQIISVYTNAGSGSSPSVTLSSSGTGFAADQALLEVMSCTATTTDSSGSLSVTLSAGVPKVYYPASALSGSGICTSATG